MLPLNIPHCHHIHLNGIRCGSPALRGQSHCYYHSVLRQERDVPPFPISTTRSACSSPSAKSSKASPPVNGTPSAPPCSSTASKSHRRTSSASRANSASPDTTQSLTSQPSLTSTRPSPSEKQSRRNPSLALRIAARVRRKSESLTHQSFRRQRKQQFRSPLPRPASLACSYPAHKRRTSTAQAGAPHEKIRAHPR